MGLAVYSFGSVFAGGIHQTEDLPSAFIVPIPLVIYPVLVLYLQVPHVSIGYGLSRQPFHLAVKYPYKAASFPPYV